MKIFEFLKGFKEQLEPSNVKHILLNWSMSELGQRHPELPAGIVFRDQFQTETFAGRTKSILSGDGISYHEAETYTVNAEKINLNTNDITSLKFNGKHINKSIFESSYVPSFVDPSILSVYKVISPTTFVQNSDGSVGKIVGAEPLSTLFSPTRIFEDETSGDFLPAHAEIYQLFKGYI